MLNGRILCFKVHHGKTQSYKGDKR